MAKKELDNRRFSIINRAKQVHLQAERDRRAAGQSPGESPSLPSGHQSPVSERLDELDSPQTHHSECQQREESSELGFAQSRESVDGSSDTSALPRAFGTNENSTGESEAICPPSPRPQERQLHRQPPEKAYQVFSDGTVREVPGSETPQNLNLHRVSSNRANQSFEDEPMPDISEAEIVEDGLWQIFPTKKPSETSNEDNEDSDHEDVVSVAFSDCPANFSAFFPIFLELCSTFGILLPREPKMDDPSTLLNPFDDAKVAIRNILFREMPNQLRRRVFLYHREIDEGLMHLTRPKPSSPSSPEQLRRANKERRRLLREAEANGGTKRAVKNRYGASPLSTEAWWKNEDYGPVSPLQDISNIAVAPVVGSLRSSTAPNQIDLESQNEGTPIETMLHEEKDKLDVYARPHNRTTKCSGAGAFTYVSDEEIRDPGVILRSQREAPSPQPKMTNSDSKSSKDSERQFGHLHQSFDEEAPDRNVCSAPAEGDLKLTDVLDPVQGPSAPGSAQTADETPEMALASMHLLCMGFDVDKVKQALQSADGNIGTALEILLAEASDRWEEENKKTSSASQMEGEDSKPVPTSKRPQPSREDNKNSETGRPRFATSESRKVPLKCYEIRNLHRYGPNLDNYQELQHVLNLTRAIDVLIAEIGRLWSAYKIISLCMGVYTPEDPPPNYNISGLIERLNEYTEHERLGRVMSTARARFEAICNYDWETDREKNKAARKVGWMPFLSKSNVRRAVLECCLDGMGYHGVANLGMFGA